MLFEFWVYFVKLKKLTLKFYEIDIEVYERNGQKVIMFGQGNSMSIGYINANMESDVGSRKSTIRYPIYFSQGVVSLQSKFHKCVTLSTIKIEYIVASKA